MKLETVGPTNAEQFKMLVSNPALGECCICSICAVMSGATSWLSMRGAAEFSQGKCPGCGRVTYITAIRNFAWGKQ